MTEEGVMVYATTANLAHGSAQKQLGRALPEGLVGVYDCYYGVYPN